ncbi:hypothetical protein YC2023_008106 [Brassica napus]
MSYSHQKRGGKARESSRKAAALHAKINGKELDRPDITQICLTEILMGKQFRISWLGGIVDERKVVKQHLLEDVEETNGAWRTKAIPDPTLMPQGRTYARYLLLFAFLWYVMLPFGSNEILMVSWKEAVTLLKKADFGNFDKKVAASRFRRRWAIQVLGSLPSSALNISGSSASNIDLDFIGFIVQLLFISSISLMVENIQQLPQLPIIFDLHHCLLPSSLCFPLGDNFLLCSCASGSSLVALFTPAPCETTVLLKPPFSHVLSCMKSSIMVGFISFFLSCLAFFFSTLTGDIGSSSTTKSYVDSKGRFVDQSGFTWIGAPETEIDAFVDMETLKFTSPEKVFLLQPEISRILDAMGDDTVKYKLEVILAKDDKI